MNKMPWLRRPSWAGVLLSLLITGCATTGETDFADPRDPLEPFNRAMYNFNDGLDRAVFKPVAKGYQWLVPDPLDRGITNFFANLGEVDSVINNALQFKLQRAATGIGRLAINSTVGLLGFIDVASNMNLPRYREDFGQTFGVWGISPGPYLVLPLLGPSSGRDAFGLALDWYVEPVRWLTDSRTVRFSLLGLWFIDRRADLLGASRILEQAALDPYEFTRDAYLQKRLNDVYDGDPPLDDYEENLDEEFDQEEVPEGEIGA